MSFPDDGIDEDAGEFGDGALDEDGHEMARSIAYEDQVRGIYPWDVADVLDRPLRGV